MTASALFTAAHAAARLADATLAYRTRFVTALKSAWAAAKQTITNAMTTNITDQQVIVAENQDYKIYLKGTTNAAGFGDSTVKVQAKNAATAWGKDAITMSKFGWKESAQFLVLGGRVAPELDQAAIEAFVTQHAGAIEAAQIKFVEDFRSESDKFGAAGDLYRTFDEDND